MAAKTPPAQAEAPTKQKAVKPTPAKKPTVTKPTKATTGKTVPAVKPKRNTKAKNPRKKAAPKKPMFTSKDFERYFFALDLESFIEYTKEWNETQLKIKIPNLTEYNAWLDYFRSLPPNQNKMLSASGLDFLPSDGYSALRRWVDIINNPARIDKIHQSNLTTPPKKDDKNILLLARSNDRMGVLEAVRDKLAEQLDKRATARDMAAMAREMGDVLDQIADLQKRAGPKKGTVLSNLLVEFDVKKKRPGKNGGGARNTSFKSKVTTIDDTEGKD